MAADPIHQLHFRSGGNTMKESENKTLHVLRVEPGKAPEEKDIGSDLNSLQAEVEAS